MQHKLTTGCVFLFKCASLSFFHVGKFLSFSLSSACSSKIGLIREEASDFKLGPVYKEPKEIDYESRTHFADSVIFVAVGFFSSSDLDTSFPCFPGFFHGGRHPSVGLWAAINPYEYPINIFELSPNNVFVVSSRRNSTLWRENKAKAYVIFDQS